MKTVQYLEPFFFPFSMGALIKISRLAKHIAYLPMNNSPIWLKNVLYHRYRSILTHTVNIYLVITYEL